MTRWNAVLLIYSSIDARLGKRSRRRFKHALSSGEIEQAIASFRQFPGLVEQLTSGKAGIDYAIERIDRPLDTLTEMGQNVYWPSPVDTREEIEKYALDLDSVFVFWPDRNLATGEFVPCAGWGLGLRATDWSNGATYATVGNADAETWNVPVLGEVWLHEWLHGVCACFAEQGHIMPDGDADGGGRHGYAQSPVTGWTDYYRDLMTGNVLENDTMTGIPLEAWEHKAKTLDQRSLS